jgi:hypothetical protein
MNEQHLGNGIRSALDAGLVLAPGVAARLHRARELALAHHVPTGRGFAAAIAEGAGAFWLGQFQGSWAQIALSVALLVTALAGVHYWQDAREAMLAVNSAVEQYVDVDTRVLTGDLPINAYLDEDFQTWLKQSSE